MVPDASEGAPKPERRLAVGPRAGRAGCMEGRETVALWVPSAGRLVGFATTEQYEASGGGAGGFPNFTTASESSTVGFPPVVSVVSDA